MPRGQRRRAQLTFQSTLPLRGATNPGNVGHAWVKISIHAPLTGSDLILTSSFLPSPAISIHAPLTGSDYPPARGGYGVKDFNPRSPYGERPSRANRAAELVTFQSTLPLRGATVDCPHLLSRAADFNPRSPYGERPASSSCGVSPCRISIHAPLTGSDI